MLRASVFLLSLVTVLAERDSFQWFRSRRSCKDVMTEAGLVRGCAGPKDAYMAWLGVPYAAPPTGSYRFKPPLPPFAWKGVYEADLIVKCAQDDKGVEDCLVVNIFTPMKLIKPLPVLVYIHGGSFLIGSGQVKGVENLIQEGIIVVTMNYRLGAFGFLCLGIESAPGNAGLKDQVAALQWIQRNIANFGGDPNQVTVYGMSAGGASVEMLVLSEQGKGLFKNAIVESASANSVWTVDDQPIQTALMVARRMNIPIWNINISELGNYYQRMHVKALGKATLDHYEFLTDGTFGFVPCVEKPNVNNTIPIFTESPYNILIKEKYQKVPMMFLFSSVEGLFLRSEEYYKLNYKERMSKNFLDFLPGDLQFDTPEIALTIAEQIREFYFANRTIGEDIMSYLNYFGDYLIMHGLLNSVEIHSRNNNPVYLMEFAYKGNLGSYEKIYETINLAGHGDVIKHAILEKPAQDARDKLAVARVTKLIANFVKFGNPTPQRSDILPILWPRVYPGNISCLFMDDDLRVIEEPRWFAKRFWDILYSAYRKPIGPLGLRRVSRLPT